MKIRYPLRIVATTARLILVVVPLFLTLSFSQAHGESRQEPPTAITKKIIQVGWGQVATDYIRDHVASMETLPLDGVVFDVKFVTKNGKNRFLSSACFGREAIPPEAIEGALRDLQSAPFKRFTDNFVRCNTQPGDIDWFEDFSPVLHNIRAAARITREAHLKGIFLDVEPYQEQIFKYATRPQRETKSYADYAFQVRRIARSIIEIIEAEAPQSVVFLPFGYETTKAKSEPRDSYRYGLLAPFLDGLLEGAKTVEMVNGYEASYAAMQEKDFSYAYNLMKSDIAFSALPEKYRRHFRFGFGLWMDLESGAKGWFPNSPEKNPFPPNKFQAALLHALRQTDKYVWIYTQQPRWWPKEKLPPEYLGAISRARIAIGLTNPKESAP